MANHEIKGDWMLISRSELDEVSEFLIKAGVGVDEELIRNPALLSLNFDIQEGFEERMVIATEIVKHSDVPANLLEDRADADFDYAVHMRFFDVYGRTAIQLFESYRYINSNGYIDAVVRYHVLQFHHSTDEMRDIEVIAFMGFMSIQYLMLNCNELFSCRKEYRKELKACHGSKLETPYTRPGKVRIFKVPSINDEVRERIKRSHEIHIWHCPAWGVRGHYRHYKNGKVSYVRPYVKGAKKEAYTGREYELAKEAPAWN